MVCILNTYFLCTVTGEKIVTPGAVVSFTLKLRLAPPGQTNEAPAAVDALHAVENAEGAEKSVEELIGRSRADEGVVPTPLAHAPHFPKVRGGRRKRLFAIAGANLADSSSTAQNRKPAWYIFVGDHKLNRVFVAPHRFTDIGEGTTRTVRMTFQAPPGPGLYTFQVYVMCDSFVGADAQKDMRMLVEAPKEGDDVSDLEDDISEPDEDSLAGQMALMKGQPVRRQDGSDHQGSEDESGTDSETESSSSDSDSDSD